MKIAVIGATGMLGHRIFSSLSENHDVYGIVRTDNKNLYQFPNIKEENVFDNIDILDFKKLEETLIAISPELVINGVGIIKQVDQSKEYITSIEVNSLFPHQLGKLCAKLNARMIHFSTDCVFNGEKGNYSEEDDPNANDLYGKSKHLGEVDYLENVLTLRTSLIGREVNPKGSLIDWFLSQEGKEVKGFSNAIFSGFPTLTISKIIDQYIIPNKQLYGVMNLACEPVDKYDLLNQVKELFKANIKIKRFEDFKIDRSLNGKKFNEMTGLTPLPWKELVKDLAIDNDIYCKIRKENKV